MRFEEKTGIKVCYGIDILSGHVIFETNFDIDSYIYIGSVVECLIRDLEAAGLSLTGVTALSSLSKTHLS